jgi:hypothetical protein
MFAGALIGTVLLLSWGFAIALDAFSDARACRDGRGGEA